ncbi:unnamed protein product [Peniophora sp. CBMAI 1063]|nr:unnamed protein product [Peniophora sp. CBMAI 1063]
MSTATTTKTRSPVTFAAVTPNNLGTVRKLNSVIFPVRYSDQFYSEVLQPEVEDFCQLVYYNDIPIGSICCKLETQDGKDQLYLQTMGVLAPYRNLGVGAQALQHVIDAAAARQNIQGVYAHVHVTNEDAKRFYEKHDFKEVGVDETYYKKIKPPVACILERRLH